MSEDTAARGVRTAFTALSAKADVMAIAAVAVLGAWTAVTLGGSRWNGVQLLALELLVTAACATGISIGRWSLRFANMRRVHAGGDRAGGEWGTRGLPGRVANAGTIGLGGTITVVAGALVATSTGATIIVRELAITTAIVAAFVGAIASRRWPATGAVRLVLAAEVLVAWGVLDAVTWTLNGRFYDLRVYLAAGAHANAGNLVYLPGPLIQLPASASADWFLYPPPLVPVMQLAALGPLGLTVWGFAAAMAACGVLAYRLIGCPWAWSLLLVAFPPMVKGIQSGNVANLTFLLLAGAIRWGPGLALGTLFKVQNLVPAAWLLRERHWRDVLAGGALVLTVSLVTLPLVGINSWRAWAAGLIFRAQSQVNLPILYGDSLAALMPAAAFLVISAAAFGIALWLRERRGLAALGLASIVASPSLWPHGFVMATPALLALPSVVLVWFALGIAANGALGLWTMVLLGALGVALGRGITASPMTHCIHSVVRRARGQECRGQLRRAVRRSPSHPQRPEHRTETATGHDRERARADG